MTSTSDRAAAIRAMMERPLAPDEISARRTGNGEPRPRIEPDDERAALMREAGDLFGSEALAKALGMSSRNLYHMMAGKRRVRAGVLADTRKLLIARRQDIADLTAKIRAAEEADDEDR